MKNNLAHDELPTVLTDIEQLEGKTIAVLTIEHTIDSLTLYYTDDNEILVARHSVGNSYGDEFVHVEYIDNMIDIYKEYEDELVEMSILTHKQAIHLGQQVQKEYEAEAHRTNERIKCQEYEQYLKLKKKFEVEWRL